uniref:Cytochrome c oxidase subunit 2 n=1 Tax=Malassezia yamatoensis TaxID=253288 RepID=A0A2I6QD23_9BASI|nr:cytochrome c oxidase subunit 2 [Malassezia yamatoensis]
MIKSLFTNISIILISIIVIFYPNIAYNDAPQPWQIGFQDGASPIIEGISELFQSVFFYLIIIVIGVFWAIYSVIKNFNYKKSPIVHHITHGTTIELIWTISPALILVAIAFPSFKLLYLTDEVFTPSMTIKAAGHQWYWSYEYSDFLNEEGESIEFDSYMVPEADLEDGQFRLLDVDNNVVVPVDTNIRFIVTGQDVIHSFAVPSLGMKIDGIPGRLNQVSTIVEREGLFYGQCSELCGVLHGFMPICIEAVSPEKYLEWMDEMAE